MLLCVIIFRYYFREVGTNCGQTSKRRFSALVVTAARFQKSKVFSYAFLRWCVEMRLAWRYENSCRRSAKGNL